ncbi:hypothetical protein F7725_014723 [Dissostichus mawsoni]|uniref:Uncharacterized protein n=1 Tax=Dissostichus mawsoni TaxID=36200 RepID=A0A7J5YWZ0_DISMA|nr:hypothetical protein F7725_014723 [Dissostichus mawsoni]
MLVILVAMSSGFFSTGSALSSHFSPGGVCRMTSQPREGQAAIISSMQLTCVCDSLTPPPPIWLPPVSIISCLSSVLSWSSSLAVVAISLSSLFFFVFLMLACLCCKKSKTGFKTTPSALACELGDSAPPPPPPPPPPPSSPLLLLFSIPPSLSVPGTVSDYVMFVNFSSSHVLTF